jgi:hypothetical protein
MAVAARMNPAARQDWHPRNELNEAQGEWTELYREDESCTAVLIRPARASERLCAGQAMWVTTGGASVSGTAACSDHSQARADSGRTATVRPRATSWANCVSQRGGTSSRRRQGKRPD